MPSQIPPSVFANRAAKAARPISGKAKPILVAIVGGSGSGKTWLTKKLLRALSPNAVQLSQDDFYADRSHLPAGQRARLNFDHPRAIDWTAVETVLAHLLASRPARVPCYDFRTHARLPALKILHPRDIILLEGLWLLRRASIRRLVSVSVFLNCPTSTRLRRRLARDLASRGRTRISIRTQFQRMVEPMHQRYVAPQAQRAHFIFHKSPGRQEVSWLTSFLKNATRSSAD
jgi:uridine kinase